MAMLMLRFLNEFSQENCAIAYLIWLTFTPRVEPFHSQNRSNVIAIFRQGFSSGNLGSMATDNNLGNEMTFSLIVLFFSAKCLGRLASRLAIFAWKQRVSSHWLCAEVIPLQ